MENSSFISDAEWQTIFNEVYGELYGILAKSGLRYFETTQSLTAATTALPAGYLSTLGVYYVNGSYIEPLEEVMFQERHHVVGSSMGRAYFYELAGSNIVLLPTYASGQTYTHYYIPQPTDYSSSITSTAIDVVTPDGESFLLWGMVFYALSKEETDATYAEGKFQQAKERLEEWALLRQLHSQRRRMVDDPPYFTDPADRWR